jgi:hypothetical protein
MPVSRTPAWLQGSALPSAPRCPVIRGIEQISPKNPKVTSLTDSTSDARPDSERSGRQGTNQELPERTQYKECHIVARTLRGEIDPINGQLLSTGNRLETAGGSNNVRVATSKEIRR